MSAASLTERDKWRQRTIAQRMRAAARWLNEASQAERALLPQDVREFMTLAANNLHRAANRLTDG